METYGPFDDPVVPPAVYGSVGEGALIPETIQGDEMMFQRQESRWVRRLGPF